MENGWGWRGKVARAEGFKWVIVEEGWGGSVKWRGVLAIIKGGVGGIREMGGRCFT